MYLLFKRASQPLGLIQQTWWTSFFSSTYDSNKWGKEPLILVSESMLIPPINGDDIHLITVLSAFEARTLKSTTLLQGVCSCVESIWTLAYKTVDKNMWCRMQQWKIASNLNVCQQRRGSIDGIINKYDASLDSSYL